MRPADSQKNIEPLISSGPQPFSNTSVSDLHLGPMILDDEIDGLDISTAAVRLGINEEDLWRRVRSGQIIARTSRGKVFVYTDPHGLENDAFEAQGTLPELPSKFNATEVILARLEEETKFDPSSGSSLVASNQELAVILDHLGHAKAENREIIRFTSESMSRLTNLTDSMLKMKDDVIASREQQVEHLKELIQSQSVELRKLTKENENLETVARFISN